MNQVNEWVSQEYQNLADVLRDYDRFLALEMVPMEEWPNLIDKSKVFRVIDTRKNQIVLYADSLSSPQDILARVWSMDQDKNNVIAILDSKNAAAQALQMRKHLDEIEAQKDFVLFLARNTKSRWTHEGRVRDEHFRDLGPVRTVIDK
jgi:tRNA splicing ligase